MEDWRKRVEGIGVLRREEGGGTHKDTFTSLMVNILEHKKNSNIIISNKTR